MVTSRHCPPPLSVELDGVDLDAYQTRLGGQDEMAPAHLPHHHELRSAGC